MKELIEKLRNGYQGIALGAEGMGWSFDAGSLAQAADAIERLELEALAADIRIENDALKIEGLNSGWYDRLLKSELTCRELLESRDAYQQAADDMAMAHKVERDDLASKVDGLTREQIGLKLDAARWKTLREKTLTPDPEVVRVLVMKRGQYIQQSGINLDTSIDAMGGVE